MNTTNKNKKKFSLSNNTTSITPSNSNMPSVMSPNNSMAKMANMPKMTNLGNTKNKGNNMKMNMKMNVKPNNVSSMNKGNSNGANKTGNNNGTNKKGNNNGANKKGNSNGANKTGNNNGANKTGNNSGGNKGNNNIHLKSDTVILVLLYVFSAICVLIVLAILYLNIIHRKDYYSIEATIIEGGCEDKDGIFGIQKSRCNFKIEYKVPDPTDNKKTLVKRENITIKDKNDIREVDNNKIVNINVHQEDLRKIKIQRDKVRDNLNLLLMLVIFILITGAIFAKYKKYF